MEMNEKELKEAVAGYIKEKNYSALAAVITEWIQPNHIATDLMNILLDSKSLNAGDSLLYKVRKGMKVRTLVPGQIPLRSEITVSERMSYVLDMMDIAVNAGEWELASGELGTVADIKTQMQLKIRDFYMNKVFTALSTIWTATNTAKNFTAVGATITETALKNMIDYINQTTPGAKAIVGARSVLTPITTFGAFWTDGSTTGWSNEALNEIMQTGWLGKFYGVPVVALEQTWDNPMDHNALIPTDKVLVIGKKVGDFITYGPEGTKEYTDMKPTPPEWNYEIYQQFGLSILNAEGIGVLGIS